MAKKEPKEPVLETRTCETCQGDGVWDGVTCEVCLGSGKIYKDGVIVATGGKTYVAAGGELVAQE